MILFGRRHPTELSLSRFADGDLPLRRQRRIGRHVERCGSCQEYVRFIHELGDVARELKRDQAPDMSELADAVIRRRRAGERGPLPDVPSARPDRTGSDRAAAARRRERRRVAEAAVAGFALVAVAAGYLLLAPSAAATRGELTFEPATAGPDATVPIVYSPAYFLADEDSLRLRADVTRKGAAAAEVGRTTESRTVTLRRDDEGRFHGTLPVEGRDVFAVAVVEDFEGVDLDTNFGRLWDLYLEHENGRPTMAALESHYRTLEAYNWVMAVEWAERLTEEFPDNPLGWALQYWHLSKGRVGSVSDSTRKSHRDKLDDLIRPVGSEPDPDELAWLARYAGYVGQTSVRDSLLRDLTLLAPNHPDAVDRRVVQAMEELGFGSRALVDRLERLWASGGRHTEFLVHSGVQAAAAAGRTGTIETWLDRGLRHPEIETAELLDDIAPYDRDAAWRASLLRMQLAELEGERNAHRPLRMTTGEHKSQRRAAILSLEVELAGALVEAGDEAAAAALYRKAADRAWRPEDIRPHVDFLLARGDTTGALPGIGLLVADPVSGDSARARYWPILEADVDDPGSFIARSRAELGRRLLAALQLDRRLRHDTRLASIEGEESTAGEFFADGPTVLLLWDARFGNGSRWLTTFKSLASREWVGDGGIQAAIVVPPTDHEAAAALGAGALPLVVDPDYGLVAQLGARAVPSFVVVNRQLEIVAGSSDAATAFRIAKLLGR